MSTFDAMLLVLAIGYLCGRLDGWLAGANVTVGDVLDWLKKRRAR